MKILIVDDTETMKLAIERTLAQEEYEIRIAQSGDEALASFEEFEPQIVTMDLTMPELDGLTTVDALLSKRSDVRILVISEADSVSTAVEAVKRGAHGFLLKPFNATSLNDELVELFRD